MELRHATRKQTKIKLALQGPAGSGKTYSALLLAFGLTNAWNNIAIIDTENHSADLYAHLGNFNVLSLDKPFCPERYIEAIELCEKAGMEVIILDSITHEWDGKDQFAAISVV
jgi:adenylylsulfate kinase-like enzyme